MCRQGRDTAGFSFESDLWATYSGSDPNTPALTPTPVCVDTGGTRQHVDGNGCPVFKKLTSGVHWAQNSYPAWNENDDVGDESMDIDIDDFPTDSNPSSILNGENSGNSREEYFAMKSQMALFSVNRIASMVDEVRRVLGFQFDASVNVFELLMSQLDSRASRSGRLTSLVNLHRDYIGGDQSNFRKWYFAAGVDLLDRNSERVHTLFRKSNTSSMASNESHRVEGETNEPQNPELSATDDDYVSLDESQEDWDYYMNSSSNQTRLTDIIIYLFCWTEANQIRFMPECLAFIVKCARDYFYYVKSHNKGAFLEECFFIDKIITPLYDCYRNYNYSFSGNQWIHKDNDHKSFIGYDDMNQLFWYKAGLEKIVTRQPVMHFAKDFDAEKGSNQSKSPSFSEDELGSSNESVDTEFITKPLVSFPRNQWYLGLTEVNWSPLFAKTYRESRTWLHVFTNFSRIWILHVSMFWYYTSLNTGYLYTPDYNYMDPESAGLLKTMAVVSLGGCFGPLITLIALIGEARFVPRKFEGAEPILWRIILSVVALLVLMGPATAIIVLQPWSEQKWGINIASTIGLLLLILSIVSTVYFSTVSLDSLYFLTAFRDWKYKYRNRQFLANKYFTSNFAALDSKGMRLSWLMWVLVFTSKFVESYFFLTLSLKDPLRELFVMDLKTDCGSDKLLKSMLGSIFSIFVLVFVIFTDFVLFCLDTYLWYVIFNTVISASIALHNGASIWTPWKNTFSRLPQRISAKMISPKLEISSRYSNSMALRIVWNSIVESLLSRNFLNKQQAETLMYVNPATSEPRFFTVEEDGRTLKRTESEAYRRISFFAQSLSSPMPHATTVNEMPGFTVLIPYYKEKMVLSLDETIKAGSNSKITILEYLQKLYPTDWQNYVKSVESDRYARESKLQSIRKGNRTGKSSDRHDRHERHQEPSQDQSNSLHERHERHQERQERLDRHVPSSIALQKLGFDSLDPNDTTRTRLWCSKRAQTLYRTISGFSEYSNALKVLYIAETQTTSESLVEHIHSLCKQKFRLLVAMQLYQTFTPDQLRDVETMMRDVPELTVSYVERLVVPYTNKEEYYSCMFDSSCPLLDSGKRVPRIRIKLSGNPILGDGKSDNQNSALPFYRGEFIQLVDANQDNYLEECLKIRNILKEFDETKSIPVTQPSPRHDPERCDSIQLLPSSTVAIVGAREYIFSENIGILGDIAAGKEQTFGTLFARTLATVGAKLHYGHPDFVNAIFMTTRGGVSKGQRGLHLNEDIYAGMTAVLRGGRIKHSEYFQCGKGRDLGFVSILNFTSKIGAGMGEQVLSREYFYMGTHLPFDRFASFFYAHPGFHLNNVFITLALQLLLLIVLWVASIAFTKTLCEFDPHALPTTPHTPEGCVNLLPMIHWIRHCVISIFLVFFISLCPLFLHELIEKGFIVSLVRITKHFASLSMLFEVFVAHIYARSFSEDLNIGGARYVSTGRDFATTRMAFQKLFSGYSCEILRGFNAILSLLFSSTVLWHPCYLWFWVTSISLCISPVLYNPHQFSFVDFVSDYMDLLKWFYECKGDSESWESYIRSSRQKITGVNKKQRKNTDIAKPNIRNMILVQLGGQLISALCFCVPYFYVSIDSATSDSSVVTRLGLSMALPLVASIVMHVLMFFISLLLNLLQIKNFANIVAMTVRLTTALFLVVSWWVIYIFEHRKWKLTILGVLSEYGLHKAVCCLLSIIQHKQYSESQTNTPWWTGEWKGTGYRRLFLVPNELIAKISESIDFSYDFIILHCLVIGQLPVLAIPYVDKLHSLFLLWLKPKINADSNSVISVNEILSRQIRMKTVTHLLALIAVGSLVIGLVLTPVFLPNSVTDSAADALNKLASGGLF